MSLEDKLTEEQKSHILDEVERERRKYLVYDLWKKLAPRRCAPRIAHLLKEKISTPEEASELFRREVLTSYFQDLFNQVYSAQHVSFRSEAAGIIRELEKRKGSVVYDLEGGKLKKESRNILEEMLKNRNDIVCRLIGYDSVRYALPNLVIYALPVLFPPPNPLFTVFCEKGMNSKSPEVRCNAAAILSALPPFDVGKYLSLYKQGLQDENWDVQFVTAITLGSLATVDYNLFMKLFSKNIKKPKPHIQFQSGYTVSNATFFSLLYLYGTSEEKPIVPIRDTEYAFFEQYLGRLTFGSSIIPADLERVTEQLKGLARTFKGEPKRLLQTFVFNKTEDLDELAECAELNSDRYIFVRKLGSGTSGTTYKVYSSVLQQYRAIKIIDEAKVNHSEAVLMARLLGKDLEHIVQVYDAGYHIIDTKKKYAIVMEYVDGETLDELMKKGPLSIQQIISYSPALLEGILALRRYGITHRDINPRNIKVNSEGKIKILDFGIATTESNPPQEHNRRYGMPEGKESDDFFSLGLIVYEMASGEHLISPRDSATGTETFANCISELKLRLYNEDGNLREEYKQKLVELRKQEEKRQQRFYNTAPYPVVITDFILCLLEGRYEESKFSWSCKLQQSLSIPFDEGP